MATSLSCPDSGSLAILPSSSINLLPFHLKYTGPAPISTYFRPRVIPAPPILQDDDTTDVTPAGNEQARTITVAAFRGRRVQAYTSQIPEGYIGLLLSAPPIPTSATIDVPAHTVPSQRVASLRHVSTGIASHDPSGPRRSPRKRKAGDVPCLSKPLMRAVKKKVVKRVSLDSDSEEDDSVVKQEAVEVEENGAKADITGDNKEDKFEEAIALDQVSEDAEPAIGKAANSSLADAAGKYEGAPSAGEASSDERLLSISRSDPIIALPTQDGNGIREPSIPFLSRTRSPSPGPPLQISPPDEPLLASRNLIPDAKFSAFTIWSPDGALDAGRDEYVRALGEWMTLGREIHRNDLV